MAIEFSGFLYDDAGDAVNGATVNLYDRNTTSSVRATTTTNSSGYFTISHATQGRFDIEVVNGSSKRRLKYDNEWQMETLEVNNFRIRNPTATDGSSFEYDIVPQAITAARQLNLPLIGGTATLIATGTPLLDDETLVFGTGSDAKILWSDADANNHSLVIGVGDSNQSLHITDLGAIGTDWDISATTHPNVYIHSNTDPANEYLRLGSHDATSAEIDVVGGTTLKLMIAGTSELSLTSTALAPTTSDGSALGTASLMWGDLFLASASVINWHNGDITLTHGAGTLTFGGDGTVGIDFNNHEMTNVDIDSGAIDGTTIGAASTAAGSFAAIAGTTIDASTDFTIGDTVITDGVITDSTGLQINAAVDLNDKDLDNIGSAASTWNGELLQLSSANDGGTNSLYSTNSSDTTDSFSQMRVVTGGTSAGDPLMVWDVSGTTQFAAGIDNSASDRFAIGKSAGVTSNNALRMTAASPPVITYNTSHPTGTFDYACDECSWHGDEKLEVCPECEGNVQWRDDAMDYYRGIVLKQPEALEYLERVGVIERSWDTRGVPQEFTVLGQDVRFAWAMAFQLRNYIVAQDKRIRALEDGRSLIHG